ncbi:Smr/MutS family protein [Shewanella sp. JM162201]|uniref:Smr/MutS family protein n=1 Tax=Shewanella jiangmenensis TaxID=2837387 RepID=A0ABS5V657_9GAMM|nr:Smr/MutS family protein [Shewanella jiangmenensis]MBT1445934.1 Smr/MutS family protein [Shewanella jiangmenensis]
MMHEEQQLFMAEMADVKPLKSAESHFFVKAPQDEAAQKARREAADIDERLLALSVDTVNLKRVKGDEIVSFAREGVQEAVLKTLRLGRYEAKTRFDFRGLSLSEARKTLLELIDGALFRGERNLLLVCGKGLGNKPFEAVMKSALTTWLSQLEVVRAFHSATREEGGSGALYVMLIKSEAEKIHSRETNRRGARR